MNETSHITRFHIIVQRYVQGLGYKVTCRYTTRPYGRGGFAVRSLVCFQTSVWAFIHRCVPLEFSTYVTVDLLSMLFKIWSVSWALICWFD